MIPLLRVSLVVLILMPALQADPIIREPGAIYLSDFAQKPLLLKVLRPAPCYFDIGMTRYAGTLRFPQTVEVTAVDDQGCRIKGNAQQGGVAAWVPYAELQPLPSNLLSNLKKSEERRKIVDNLIRQGQAAIGMTNDEVRAALGKPQKTTDRADASGTSQVWEFIKYELVPQTVYGPGSSSAILPGNRGVVTQSGYYANTIYVKVPVGTLTVTFKDGVVTSLDQTKGTLVGNNATIVVPPVNFYW